MQRSSHGWCRKAALASGLIGVFVSYVMGNFAIQLYTLAFKAELTTLAMLQTLIMVWDTLNEPLIGMMQARPHDCSQRCDRLILMS